MVSEQRTTEQKATDQHRLEINWVNSLGGALAAVSSAVLLSTLGTAGTLIGAAIGSLVITVGGAVYAHSLRVARARIAAGRTVLVRTRGDGGAGSAEVHEVPKAPEARDEPASTTSRWQQVLRELPWKRVVAASAALFVVAMGVIVAFELTAGRPLSAFTGGTSDTDSGTSVPGIGGGGDESEDEAPDDEVEPSPDEDEGEPTEEEPPAEESPAPVEETTPPPVEEPTAPEETGTP